MTDHEASANTTPTTTTTTSSRPLAESIAAATRSAHAKLNKLIIARLPLALPPRAQDPTLYVSGLLHIAPIYLTFEALWQNILDAPCTGAREREERNPDGHLVPIVDERLHEMLERLHLPELLRSSRLRADIGALTGWPEHVVEEQLRTVGLDGRLAEFLGHMKRSIENRPHVLLAYSYIFFMALFAGGRYIRASLESVGDDFWNQVPSPVMPTMQACDGKLKGESDAHRHEEEDHHRTNTCHAMPLRFFHFPTPSDGEDLKREFKKRLAASEAALTTYEKDDVVQEAVCIFDNMTLLIQQLDHVCEGVDQGVDHTDGRSFMDMPGNILAGRLRDSVAVAKERRSARNSSRPSDSSDESFVTSYSKLVDEGQQTITPPSTHADGCLAIPGAPGLALCPAMAGGNKSMRFEKPAAHPRHVSSFDGSTKEGLAEGLGERVRLASKSLRSVRVANFVLVAALGVIVFGAFVTGRRGAGWLVRDGA